MKYKKYRIIAEGTVEISNTNVKDVKDSTFLSVDGAAIRAKIIVKRVQKQDPDIPSSGHL